MISPEPLMNKTTCQKRGINVLEMPQPSTGFEQFTDPEKMRAIFQEYLPGCLEGKQAITQCEVTYRHYKRFLKTTSRHKNFLAACYQIHFTETLSGKTGKQIVYAKAFCGGRSLAEYEKLQQLKVPEPASSQNMIHLAEFDMILWVFPHDPALPHLPEVMEPERVIKALPLSQLPSGFDLLGQPSRVNTTVVHYRPECRCTIRYDLQWEQPRQPKALTLFGKTFRNGEGKVIYQRMQYLWDAFQKNPSGIRVAQPLAYDPSLKTIWQIGARGIPLHQIIDSNNYHRYIRSVARGLAALHQSDLKSPLTLSLQDHLEEARKKSTKLTQWFPSLHKIFRSLMQQLEVSETQWTTIPFRLIYGDFHIKQLLGDGDDVVFFDFDEFAQGDPMQDLANFIVDLHFHGFPPTLVQKMGRTLVNAYRSFVPWDVSVKRISWHAGIQFTNKAYRSYIQRKPSLDEEMKLLVKFIDHEMILDSLQNTMPGGKR